MSYSPRQVPAEYNQAWFSEELGRINQGFIEYPTSLGLKVLYASPPRIRAGMIVYADGVTWNPGGGEGVYRRDKANAAWVLLG